MATAHETMMDLALSICLQGSQPVRVRLTKQVTTIGSDPAADLRLSSVPAHWAVLHTLPGHVEILLVSTQVRHRLVVGTILDLDGVLLELHAMADVHARERAIEELASALAAVESADRAVDLLLRGLIAAAEVDIGALILAEAGTFRIAAARDRDGAILDDARELLSDTIVRDVLGTGERVQVDDLVAHSRYAAVPSVAALRLRSAICLPMRLDGKTLGAIFLAKRSRTNVDDRMVAELRILAAIAVPFLAQLRRPPEQARDELVGESPVVQRLRALVKRIGPSDLSVLLHGPSGSGKELVARAVHRASPRANKPLIAINCASVAPTLLDAELFGYRKGAFTGAVTDRVGLIEAAHESTLFLDEIGDMPLPMQAALLRVLELREIKRLGDNLPRPVDFRVIAATHRDLDAEVTAGRFRSDLLFRLREVTVEIASLAERGDDIELLAHTFLRQAEAQLGLVMHTFAKDALLALRSYPWPGNIRELKATMRRIAILTESKIITASDLGIGQVGLPPVASSRPPVESDAAASIRDLIESAISPTASIQPLASLRDELVRRYVQLAIERSGDDREAAARLLGIGVRTLYRYIS
jgi:transcriptional regulator with GAF, ATPase, and Fis domain